MKEIISLLSSLILSLMTVFRPTTLTTSPTPPVAETPTAAQVTTVKPTSKPQAPSIKTPSVVVNSSGYVITARRGNKVQVSSVVPMKTTMVTGVSFDGGSPTGTSWSTTIENGRANIFLTVGNGAQIGEQNWTQKIVVSFDAGYTRDFAYTVKLKVISQ